MIQIFIQKLFVHLTTRLFSTLFEIKIDTTRRLKIFLTSLSFEKKQNLRKLHYDIIIKLLIFFFVFFTIRKNRKTFERNQIKLNEF